MSHWSTKEMAIATHRERVETFLSGRIPDLISQHTVLQTALLCKESGTNRWLLVGLEFIRDLQWRVMKRCRRAKGRLRTNRSTIDDFPTAASPVVVQNC